MGEEAELAALARRFVELWQRQLSALAADPQAAALAARMLGGAPEDERAAAQRAAPAPPAPGGGDGGLDELARRLAACEERLARLEAAVERRGGQARAGARRSRS